MDVVADGGTAREEAQRQLEADNLGELGQSQDRYLGSEPALDPARRRGRQACRRPGPVEAEVPVPASSADLPARPANGRVGALVGAVNEALDRCHAAIVGGVTYMRLNGDLPLRARCRRCCAGTETPPEHAGRACAPAPAGRHARPRAGRPARPVPGAPAPVGHAFRAPAPRAPAPAPPRQPGVRRTQHRAGGHVRGAGSRRSGATRLPCGRPGRVPRMATAGRRLASARILPWGPVGGLELTAGARGVAFRATRVIGFGRRAADARISPRWLPGRGPRGRHR